MSNRFQLVERENIHPIIEGVDFGGPTHVMVRSPKAVLLWVGGHMFFSGRGYRAYAGPQMVMIGDRSGRQHFWKVYKDLLRDQRLTKKTLTETWPKISEVFGEDCKEFLFRAALKRPRGTLLIEGGGPPLMPDRRRWESEYKIWRDLPEKGLICRSMD